jgi:hypothetical protein
MATEPCGKRERGWDGGGDVEVRVVASAVKVQGPRAHISHLSDGNIVGIAHAGVVELCVDRKVARGAAR